MAGGWKKTSADRRRDNRTYDARWRRAREECLKRAGWRCEIRLEGVCIGAATQVDHVAQAANDPQHRQLRAACEPCHKKVTGQQGRAAQVPRDPAPRPRTQW